MCPQLSQWLRMWPATSGDGVKTIAGVSSGASANASAISSGSSPVHIGSVTSGLQQ